MDDRFFWNKHMIQDLIDLQVNDFWVALLVVIPRDDSLKSVDTDVMFFFTNVSSKSVADPAVLAWQLYVLITSRALSEEYENTYWIEGVTTLSHKSLFTLDTWWVQSASLSTWKTFWMLQVPEVDFWVIPVIQGFVQVEELVVNYNETSDEERSSPETPPQEVTCVDDIHPRFTVALISRRSRHRAGRATVTVGLA